MAGRLTSRLALLRHSRFRLLFVATFASGIGNWLAVIALQVDVYDRTHSGLVGRRPARRQHPARGLPRPAARAARRPLLPQGADDRLRSRPARGLRCAAVHAVRRRGRSRSLPLAGIGNAFFRPAVLAGLPNLVADEDLPAANALLQLVEWTTTAVGPIVGGAIVAASGPAPRLLGERGHASRFSAIARRGIPAALLPSRPADRAGATGATSARAIAPSGARAR